MAFKRLQGQLRLLRQRVFHMREHHQPLCAKGQAVQIGVLDMVEHDTDVALVVEDLPGDGA